MNLNQAKHIIIVDTAAFDEVAFDIIVNFERMLNRRIPNVDMGKWLYAAACDGKFPINSEPILALFLKKKGVEVFQHLNFNCISTDNNVGAVDIDGLNFHIEFEEYEGSADHALIETIEKVFATATYESVENLVCVPGEDIAQYTARILSEKRNIRSTVLTQETLRGGGFSQEFLSCSISYALGVTDKEIESNGTPVEAEI